MILVAGMQPDVIHGANRPSVPYDQFKRWSAQACAEAGAEKPEAEDFHVSIAIDHFAVADLLTIKNQHYRADWVGV